MTLRMILAAGLVSAGLTTTAMAQNAPRIYISADMEGLTGVVTPEQLGPEGSEYARFQDIMLGEVVAAIDGARAAGAREFVVSDSHGNMQNLPVDRLPKDVTLVRGEPRPLSMMEGVQNGHFDGVIFIGYHASASSVGGVRAHTMSSARLSEVKINGVPASEGYINALIAGQYGVPVIMVSGDNAAVEEVKSRVGDMEVAPVKQWISFHAAETMSPAAAQDLIRARAEAAVRRIGDFKPLTVKAPIRADITFHFYRPAELLSWLPIIERTGSRSIAYTADTPSEVSKFMTFMLNYDPNAKP